MTEKKSEYRKPEAPLVDIETTSKLTPTQQALIIAILASAFSGTVITLLRMRQIDGTALLYVGLPTLIALAFAKTSKAKSVVGSTLKAITFIILISGPLLQEGFICMIMAAPIFYIVGALAAWPFDHYRKKKRLEQEASKLNMFVLPTLLLLMSMEGVFEETTFDRENVVENTQVINASVAQIKARLASTRRVGTPDSLFAQLFPRPDVINSNGLSVGDKQWVDLTYAKWVYWNEKKGQAQFKVVEHQPQYIRFKPDFDNSYLNTYLSWGDTELFMHPLSENRTRVTWRINFTRKIDPAWYVQPLQRYAVGLLAKQFVTTLQ